MDRCISVRHFAWLRPMGLRRSSSFWRHARAVPWINWPNVSLLDIGADQLVSILTNSGFRVCQSSFVPSPEENPCAQAHAKTQHCIFDLSLVLHRWSVSLSSCRFHHKQSAAEKQRVKQGWIAWIQVNILFDWEPGIENMRADESEIAQRTDNSQRRLRNLRPDGNQQI